MLSAWAQRCHRPNPPLEKAPFGGELGQKVLDGICLACCAQAKGTVTEDITKPTGNYDGLFIIEHPSGALQVALQMTDDGEAVDVKCAGIVRTARLLFTGQIFVPSSATGGTKTTNLEEQVA